MARQTYKPTTPGLRHRVKLVWDNRGGIQDAPEELRAARPQTGGRNNRGRITSQHRGGGNKRLTRVVGVPSTPRRWRDGAVMGSRSDPSTRGPGLQDRGYGLGTVVGIQQDPNRTAQVALVAVRSPDAAMEPMRRQDVGQVARVTQDVLSRVRPTTASRRDDLPMGSARPRFQMPVTQGMRVGTRRTWMVSQDKTEGRVARGVRKRSPGSTVFFRDVTVGRFLHSREVSPGAGGKRVRAAGTQARVVRKSEEDVRVRLPSGKLRRFLLTCRATVGSVDGEDHQLEVLGKAGKMRHRSVRPTVRGCAMNPVDHPHGGRTRGGRPTVTPWARVAKGQPTHTKRSVFVVTA